MKKIIWKFKYMLAIRKLLGLSIRASWGMSGSAVENYGDDINIWTPQQAAEEERDEWLACS